jgi:hypothetical protein
MNRRIFLFFPLAALLIGLFAGCVQAETDIDQHRDCSQCGMDRKAYGYSRMLIEYKDGKAVGTCSLHCVVTELHTAPSGEVLSFMVADRTTRVLIDAEKAVWTIGGKKRGVMTMRPKWAFATREAAQQFITEFGGKIVSWSEALDAAREDAGAKPR